MWYSGGVSESATWIDLTDLVSWRRPYVTGIQRVTLNLATRFRQRELARFCAFNDLRRRFVEIDPDPILSRLAAPAPRRAAYDLPPMRLEQAARRVAQQIPLTLRAKLPTQRVKSFLRSLEESRILAAMRGEGTDLRQILARVLPSTSRGEVRLAPGDRLVLMGGEWAATGYGRALAHIKANSRCRVYELIYDLIPAILPHTCGPAVSRSFLSYMFEAVVNADGVVVTSKATTAELERFCSNLSIPLPPLEAFRLGEDLNCVPPIALTGVALTPRYFILTVGTIEFRKNQALLYQVWRLAQEEGIELPPLVIVGRLGWLAGDVLYAMREDPLVKGKIYVLTNVGDGELVWLYQNCLFTVFPSLYEGWGLPVAESLAFGRMCLTTRGGAIPEIAGDLLDYFSPYDARACLNLIVRYLDEATLAAKEQEIRSKYRVWTWDQAFDQFLEALASLDRVSSRRS